MEEEQEIVGRKQDANSAPWVKHQKIIVATDDDAIAGGERQCQCQVFVILRIAAISDGVGWIEVVLRLFG
jgi:hypothetical protein